jgi:hypothetical protein
LDAGTLTREKQIEILTNDATFYILDPGLYRIDVRPNGETEILVFRGLVEAAGADGSLLVKNANRLILTGGRFQGRPASFFAAAFEDAFDRFNENRASIVNRQFGRRYLPEELSDLEYELDEYGEWTSTDEWGYVWVPRGMASDWRPYYMGHWTWIPFAGWVWVPYEPWGWGPYHYGRWHWGIGMGWYWIPQTMWGPAWVNWWWDDYYYGWAPMSWWGYPGVLHNGRYYGRGWNGDYPYNSRALTVVRRDQLSSRNIAKSALGEDNLRSISKISLSSKAPDLKATGHAKVSVEALDNGRMILRKGGDAAGAESASGRRISSETGTASTRGTTASTEAKSGEGRKIDRGTETAKETARVKGGETGSNPPSGSQTSTQTSERRIRKRDETSSGGTSQGSGSTRIKNDASDVGMASYPSSRTITRTTSSSSWRDSDSLLGSIYRRYSGEHVSGTTSRSGSSGSSISGSSSKSGSSSRSGSSYSGSSSRSGSSSSGRSSSGSSSSSSRGSSGSSGGSRSAGGGSARRK